MKIVTEKAKNFANGHKYKELKVENILLSIGM